MLVLTLWPMSIFTTPFSELQPMVYFPAVPSHSEHPHPCPPLSVFFSFFLHPRGGCQAAEKDFTHTHTHPTMPLRVFRMSLFRSRSVQVAGKQAQSLSGNFSAIPTSTYLLPCCTIISFLNFKAESEARLESSSVHKLLCFSPLTGKASNIGCGWWCCCVLPCSLFSLCVCQTDRLVLSTPPNQLWCYHWLFSSAPKLKG